MYLTYLGSANLDSWDFKDQCAAAPASLGNTEENAESRVLLQAS